MIMSRTFAVALLLLACSACASAAGAAREGASPGAGAEARPRARASGSITRADIEATSYRDAYSLIEAVRPRWLRGQRSGAERTERVVVMVGTVELGSVESLRQVSLDTVESIEFLDSFDATQSVADPRYAGTIRVILRTRR